MKCLDTDFLVAILRGKESAQQKMKALDSEGRHATTAVNVFELFYGAYRSEQREANVERTTTLFQRLDILPLDSRSSQRAGELLAGLATRGYSIDFRDAMIAGIANANGLALVTRNENHFSRFKSLRAEPW